MKKLIALGLSAIVASLCVLTFSGCGEEKTPIRTTTSFAVKNAPKEPQKQA